MKRTDRLLALAGVAISIAAPVVCTGASFVVETRVVWEETNGVFVQPANNSSLRLEDGRLLIPYIELIPGPDTVHVQTVGSHSIESELISLHLDEPGDVELKGVRLFNWNGRRFLLLTAGESFLYEWNNGDPIHAASIPGRSNAIGGLVLGDDGTFHLIESYLSAILPGQYINFYSWTIVQPDLTIRHAGWGGAPTPIMHAPSPLVLSNGRLAGFTLNTSVRNQGAIIEDSQFALLYDARVVVAGAGGGEYWPLATVLRPSGKIDALVQWTGSDSANLMFFREIALGYWVPVEIVGNFMNRPGASAQDLSRTAYYKSGNAVDQAESLVLVDRFPATQEFGRSRDLTYLFRDNDQAGWEASPLRHLEWSANCEIIDPLTHLFSDGDGIVELVFQERDSEAIDRLIHLRALNTHGSDWESVPGACLAVFLGHLELLPAGLAPYDKDGNGFVDAADYIARHDPISQ